MDALAALYRDPDVRRYFPDGTLTREQTAAEIQWHSHEHPDYPSLGLWATIDRATGALIGRCGLLPWTIEGRDEVEMAFLISKERWGEGLATEAARGIVAHARDHLGLRRLICLITHGNEASVRVAQKAGMSFERDYTDEFGPCMILARAL